MHNKKAFMLVTHLFLVVCVCSCLLTPVDAVSVEEPGHDDRGLSAVLYDNSNGLPAPRLLRSTRSYSGSLRA